ncbi:MAG TPA: glyoxylate/hydroxypyruvate reductase A [Burkholderiales bacterium]|nr:glyoxylate/hydroxypyruvate reductase A [Burkholderiales bacterium]
MRVLFQSADADAQASLDLLARQLPQAQFDLWPQGNDAAHDVAVCWKPPPGFFRGRRFRAIFNMGAGVDALLQDPELPADTPIIRLEDAGMAEQMEEYVAWAALGYLRNMDVYARQQRRAEWTQLDPRPRENFCIGIMGLGLLGERVARYLRAMGFPVRGWNRSERSIEDVTCHAGDAGLSEFLAGTQMLVCMLPLTPATQGVLNRALFAQLPRGAYLVSIGRGLHLVEKDLLDALDSGQLAGALLDVMPQEPLPAEHAFWRHPLVTVTPHISAQTLIEASMHQIAEKIGAFMRGEAVSGVIDRNKGY